MRYDDGKTGEIGSEDETGSAIILALVFFLGVLYHMYSKLFRFVIMI